MATAAACSIWSTGGPTTAAGEFEPLTAPQRIADTRPSGETVDGQFEAQGLLGAGQVLTLQVGGRAGVAPNAAGVTLNVTAVDAAAPGYLAVYPCDQPQPTSSNVNYFPNFVRSNGVFAALDGQGRVCVFTLAAVHVIVDVNGWFPDDVFVPLAAPRRIADTRPNGETFDDVGEATGKLAAQGELVVQVAGRVGVPPGATAAVLNVTVAEPDGFGFVTVYPCGATRPLASNLNYAPSDVTANSVVTRLSASGSVCLFTLAPAHIIVDVSGTLPSASFAGLDAPKRLVDTRSAGETVDGDVQGDGFRRAGTTLQFPITGRADIPANATAVALNVTAVDAESPGFLTLHPRNSTRPNASNVNYFEGGVYANTVVAAIGGDGMACLFASSDVDVLVDVAGYFVGTPPVDTGVRCPLEFPIRQLWDGYPVGEYQMPPGRYVSENPPPKDVWCEVRRLTRRDALGEGNPILGQNVAIGRFLFADVRGSDPWVDFVTVRGPATIGQCAPLVPFVEPVPAPANTFGWGNWMTNVHIQPGVYRSSRVPTGGRCVVLVVTSWDGAASSRIARYESADDDSITINVPSNSEGIAVSNTCNPFTR